MAAIQAETFEAVNALGPHPPKMANAGAETRLCDVSAPGLRNGVAAAAASALWH